MLIYCLVKTFAINFKSKSKRRELKKKSNTNKKKYSICLFLCLSICLLFRTFTRFKISVKLVFKYAKATEQESCWDGGNKEINGVRPSLVNVKQEFPHNLIIHSDFLFY